jgi:hypothetical protein
MPTDTTTSGCYFEHPRDLPLRFRVIPREFVRTTEPPADGALGGLRFESLRPVNPGAVLEVAVRCRGNRVTYRGTVHWVQSLGRRFEIGLRFSDREDAFCARMAVQACHIESYRRRRSRREGRRIGIEEAARAWIQQYAGRFPPLPLDEPASGR